MMHRRGSAGFFPSMASSLRLWCCVGLWCCRGTSCGGPWCCRGTSCRRVVWRLVGIWSDCAFCLSHPLLHFWNQISLHIRALRSNFFQFCHEIIQVSLRLVCLVCNLC